MTKEYKEADPARLVPGMRVEVRTEGTVTVNGDRLEIRTDDGSTWWFLPHAAKVYEVVELQFCLMPGKVLGKFDGDVHMVSGDQLVHLYQLRPGEYRFHNSFNEGLCRGLRHLAPRHDGDYGRPSPR